MAFTEGEAYLADAVRSACDMTTRPDHYNTYGANPPLFYWGWTLRRTQMGIPSTAYGQIPYLTGQIRQGLAVLPLAKAFMVTPDTDRHTPYFKDYMTYLAKYFADAYVYFPASQKAKGTFFPGPLLPGGHDYWMDVLSGMSCYMLWNIGDKASLSVAGIKTAAEQSALAIINCMKYSPGVAAEYTQCELDAENGYTYLPPDKNYVSFDCSVAGNVVSLSETSKNNAPFATNDEAMFVPYPSGSLKGKPSQISFFQHLWVRDVSGNTFKLAATQGGAALTLDAGTNYGITVRQVSSENQTTWNQYGSNSYATEDFLDQSHCLFELARFFGHPAIDAALGTKADTFFAGRVPQDWPTWDIDSKVLTGGDTTAPAAVSNLATSSPTSSSITLTWMAPGDDGSTGTATSYDIRYRTGGSVNDSNWASATQVTGEPAPAVAGTNQSMVVNNLTAGTTYYFAIKTSDEAPNTSAISNSPSGTTTSGGGGGGVLALKRDSGLLQGGAIDARFSGLSSATLVTVRDAGLYNSSNARYYNYGTSTLAQNS